MAKAVEAAAVSGLTIRRIAVERLTAIAELLTGLAAMHAVILWPIVRAVRGTRSAVKAAILQARVLQTLEGSVAETAPAAGLAAEATHRE